ncbi:hypothetical protein KI743_23200 [Vibrio sp. D420a]|uniref:hypothetical protein n=1 Tax=Vibrio sp. D420a TaxID=2836895 RepID=UPI00255728E7|nr:hypothetical protein [Vibrio sp. D420a]MDK9764917.1 hypothetical protein [Vibrio sp. D420a]
MNALIETGEVLAKMGKGLLSFFGLTKGNNSAPSNSSLLQEQHRTLGLGDAEYRNQIFDSSSSAKLHNHDGNY